MADKRRRKSFHLFRQRPETPPASPCPQADTATPTEKQSDSFAGVTPNDSDTSSPRVRPRTLQKASRTSVFGSLKSLHSLDEDERANLTRSDSKASSLNEDGTISIKGSFGGPVVQHGEVLSGGNIMFRKKSNYLVLTESHLIRFKNQAKAADTFPSLAPPATRPVPRGSMSSIGSFTEMQAALHADTAHGIVLEQVVAVYKLDDGRPFFTIEVSYIDEASKKSSSVQLSFHEPREAEMWTNTIRHVAKKARALQKSYLQDHILEYIVRMLERERDYDPSHFRTFKVVQIHSTRLDSRSSSEDLSRTSTSTCYLAIGVNKVHFVPLPRHSNRSSSTSLPDLEIPSSFGIVNLTSVRLQPGDDAFQIHFHLPFRHVHQMLLASCQASEIVLWLRFASEYVRPEWTIQPFIFDVPKELEERMDPPNFPTEDHNCYERTLVAYCTAYNVDTTRVVYTIDYACEDAPCFRLLPPTGSDAYTSLELLAVFRSLRYNESFTSVSFAGIDLRTLRDVYDPLAHDSDGRLTRSGAAINLPGHEALPVLIQEIRALAIKSRRLRRLDFSNAMPRSPKTDEGRVNCGIPEALAPLCKKSLTNVDWVILSGIWLGDSDIDHLVDAASDRQSHLRALEIGDCGLSVHDIDVLLSTLAIHENTMEVINLAGAQGRFSPELFQRGIGAFSRIRRLDLTRVQKTAGPEPLISPELMMCWRLEALNLSQTTLNEQSVDGVSAYLTSSKSDLLRELHLNQCGLTGKDLAILLQAMTRKKGQARDMYVSASENRLGTGFSMLTKTIADSYGPSWLSMRMIDFEKEHQFRGLIRALTENTTLKSLDISLASLPYDAGEETCEALKEMFARNTTLEELDISGEQAHLDAAKFGIGLNLALHGLEKNKTLKMLRIEHQSLGLQGANTLAAVLESNKSLREIHCDHNEINLQSFTVLINALARNKTLLYLPPLDHDRARSIEKVKNEFEQIDKAHESRSRSSLKTSGTLKKGVSALSQLGLKPGHHRHSSSTTSNTSFTEQDVIATINALEEKWQHQLARMQRYLARNHHLASGMNWTEEDEKNFAHGTYDGSDERPGTAESLGKLLARVKMDRTPTVEKPSLLEPFDGKLVDRKTLIFHLPEQDDISET